MMTARVDQIMVYVARLRDPRTKASERLEYWRWIQSAALNAHDVELRQLDGLNAAVVDNDAFVPTGGIVV